MSRIIDIIEKLHGPWEGKKYRVLPLERVKAKINEVYPKNEIDLVPPQLKFAGRERAEYINQLIEVIFGYWQ